MSDYGTFRRGGNRPVDKAAWVAQKKAEKEEIYELMDRTCAKIMTDSDSFRRYLEVQGRLDLYSVANTMLIMAQMPNATQLKAQEDWKANHIYLKRDARKVTILEPGKEYIRKDGTKGTSYNLKYLYDISETSIAYSKPPKEERQIRKLVSALIDASPVGIQPVNDLKIPAYYDRDKQKIFVRTGLPEKHLFISLGKEVAAAVFDFKHKLSRDQSNIKAYCVAYMLSSRFEVESQAFRFDRVLKAYEGLQPQDFRGELNLMRDVLGEVQGDMYRSLEKGKPPKDKEQER